MDRDALARLSRNPAATVSLTRGQVQGLVAMFDAQDAQIAAQSESQQAIADRDELIRDLQSRLSAAQHRSRGDAALESRAAMADALRGQLVDAQARIRELEAQMAGPSDRGALRLAEDVRVITSVLMENIDALSAYLERPPART